MDELGRLVEAMTAEQALRFKQALVRQAIHYVSRILPPEREDDGHRSGIRMAAEWLYDPTEEKAEAATVYGTAECWDGGVRYHDYPRLFLNPAWAAGESDLFRAAEYAVESAPALSQDAARAWQIATAKAVLSGEPPPPLE